MNEKKLIEAFPLCWPDGWKRTNYRVDSRFSTGFATARNFLFAEISRMGGSRPILSANVPLRNDGMPRASFARPDDPGVAVYFQYKKHDMVFACDKYRDTTDNVHAIAKTIEALRGIERWGASDMMERAFRGFAALPEVTQSSWRKILGFGEGLVTRDMVESQFRSLAKQRHADVPGGDDEDMRQLLAAREAARIEVA